MAIAGVLPAHSQVRHSEINSAESSGMEGRVLNSITGEPLRRVVLILRRADVSPSAYSPTSYAVDTDESGHFAFHNLEPGQYRLSANRSGFVSMEYGARNPAQAGATLSIDAGQLARNIVFPLR